MIINGQVSIVIGTYGDPAQWESYVERARESAWRQTVAPIEVLHSHGVNLAAARNSGAETATGQWLIFLDADDELDDRYVEEMFSILGDVRRPATLGITDGIEDNAPVMIPRKPLRTANFIVIGAMVERERFLRLGGFDNLPILEDWDFWLRCERDGATIVDVPTAIYKVHVRSESRNTDTGLHGQIYSLIRGRYQ